MADELIDIFDENMTPLGREMKFVAHRDKLWHRVFFCWIVHGRNVLFQLRAPQKEAHPNKLDISAAGHLKAGENVKDGLREVDEELGLQLKFENLIELETDKWVHSAEFCHTYLYKFDGDIFSFNLQREEVSGVFEIDIDQAIDLFEGRIQTLNANGVMADENGINHKVVRDLKATDFVAHRHHYNARILKKIKTFL